MARTKCSARASFAFFFIFFLAYAAGFGTPAWWRATISNTSAMSGLWQQCVVVGDDWTCDNLPFIIDDAVWIVVRVFTSLALGFYLLGFILHCAWLSKSDRYISQHGAGSVGKAALTMQFLGAVFAIVGITVYGTEVAGNFDVLETAWSFWLVAGSTFIILINSIAALGVNACCFRPENTGLVTTTTVITTNQPIREEPEPEAPPFTTTQSASPAGAYPMANYPTQNPPQSNYPPAGPPPAHMYIPRVQNPYQPPKGYPQESGYQDQTGYPQQSGYPVQSNKLYPTAPDAKPDYMMY